MCVARLTVIGMVTMEHRPERERPFHVVVGAFSFTLGQELTKERAATARGSAGVGVTEIRSVIPRYRVCNM